MDLDNLYLHPSGEATRQVRVGQTHNITPGSQASASRNLFPAASLFNEPIEQFQPIRVPKQKPPVQSPAGSHPTPQERTVGLPRWHDVTSYPCSRPGVLFSSRPHQYPHPRH